MKHTIKINGDNIKIGDAVAQWKEKIIKSRSNLLKKENEKPGNLEKDLKNRMLSYIECIEAAKEEIKLCEEKIKKHQTEIKKIAKEWEFMPYSQKMEHSCLV